jgi:MFS family permease
MLRRAQERYAYATKYVGSIVASWVTFGTVYMKHTSWGWRLSVLFQIIVPVYALAIVIFCPESPRWLVSQGKIEQAHEMLAKYHANGDKSDDLVLFELQEIKEAIEQEKEAKATSITALFKTKGNRWRLAIILVSPSLTDTDIRPLTPR